MAGSEAGAGSSGTVLETGPAQNGVITESSSAKREAGSLLETHYNELLKTIEEIGRDVKPSYTSNKVSTDRLKKNIMMARGVLRDCMGDLERLASSSN